MSTTLRGHANGLLDELLKHTLFDAKLVIKKQQRHSTMYVINDGQHAIALSRYFPKNHLRAVARQQPGSR